jgi:hypothetical protein
VYNIFNTVIGLSHWCCHTVLYFLSNPSVIFLTLHFRILQNFKHPSSSFPLAHLATDVIQRSSVGHWQQVTSSTSRHGCNPEIFRRSLTTGYVVNDRRKISGLHPWRGVLDVTCCQWPTEDLWITSVARCARCSAGFTYRLDKLSLGAGFR